MGGCVPTWFLSGGQPGSPFIGDISFSLFIWESVLAYMDSMLRWSSVPWVYSVRVMALEAQCFAVHATIEVISMASEVFGGCHSGPNFNSVVHIQMKGLYAVGWIFFLERQIIVYKPWKLLWVQKLRIKGKSELLLLSHFSRVRLCVTP